MAAVGKETPLQQKKLQLSSEDEQYVGGTCCISVDLAGVEKDAGQMPWQLEKNPHRNQEAPFDGKRRRGWEFFDRGLGLGLP